jgi:hypothetical protein
MSQIAVHAQNRAKSLQRKASTRIATNAAQWQAAVDAKAKAAPVVAVVPPVRPPAPAAPGFTA